MRKLWQKIVHHPLYIKWMNWEFWPMQIVYFPVYIQYLWLAAKARSLFFLLTTNPAINNGFLLDDPKYNTLQLVPPEYLPKMILIKKDDSFKHVKESMQEAEIRFPVILKPNIGYRGVLVKKITNENQLQDFIAKIPFDYLMQEYIDFPVEIGVFYYRFPNAESGEIPSITLKEFLKVTGDGKSTLSELLYKKPRAILQAKRLRKQFEKQWDAVIPEGAEVLLEGIGSHNRGTKFINAAALKDEALLQVFNTLNKKMNGFYFGRFDIRTASVADLKAGKNFKILEVNGVGAEPTHIYDPDYKLLKAWKELLLLWRIVYKIAIQNKKNGIALHTFSEGIKKWTEFNRSRKALST